MLNTETSNKKCIVVGVQPLKWKHCIWILSCDLTTIPLQKSCHEEVCVYVWVEGGEREKEEERGRRGDGEGSLATETGSTEVVDAVAAGSAKDQLPISRLLLVCQMWLNLHGEMQ